MMTRVPEAECSVRHSDQKVCDRKYVVDHVGFFLLLDCPGIQISKWCTHKFIRTVFWCSCLLCSLFKISVFYMFCFPKKSMAQMFLFIQTCMLSVKVISVVTNILVISQ